MKKKKIALIHPGEILKEEFLVPMGISEYRLAKEISVPARRINEIVHGKRAITADTALRLGRYFKMSAPSRPTSRARPRGSRAGRPPVVPDA